MNPGLPFALKAFEPHATVVHGYYHASMLTALLTASRFSSVFLRGESSFLGDAYRPRPRINRFILQGLLRSIDGVAAIGTANAQFYESLGVPNNRIFMTPYSVDNDYFRDRVSPESAARTRASLSIPPDAIVLGFVGKLSDVKGCRELLAAFERVKATLPGVHLVFVGEGPHGDEIRKRTRSCNRTHVVGFQPQAALATWYQMFDVFILPSLFEPWGLVVNEAMNFAVPVVVSDRVGAAYDLVEGYQCGWIFRADDAGSLDAVLRECTSLSSTELSRRGRSALQRVSQWGIAETVSGFESLVDFA
ncbi:MAG: glycosyltransferase family 4 protein [Myxococcota bacterium]